MSEYQYYEFQAIDRPLTEEEQQAVSRLSSRVDPHPWRAVFVYHWGSFRGDPEEILARYYDAMLYLANWGSRRLIFRFPKTAIDLKQAMAYCRPLFVEDYLSFSPAGEHMVLNVEFHEEEAADWIDGEGWLPSLISLRDDILSGDYRALYLAWLKAVETEDVLESVSEPPVPPGLKELSPALRSFVEFFDVDEDLVETAAERSEPLHSVSEDDWRRAIAQLAPEERDAFLLRFAQEEPGLTARLKRRLADYVDQPAAGLKARRTVGELLAAAQELGDRKRREEAARAEAKRLADLEALARREVQAWQEVESLIEKSQAGSYQQAVQLLIRLRDLAAYQGQSAAFRERLDRLQERYSRRKTFIKRLRDADLLKR